MEKGPVQEEIAVVRPISGSWPQPPNPAVDAVVEDMKDGPMWKTKAEDMVKCIKAYSVLQESEPR